MWWHFLRKFSNNFLEGKFSNDNLQTKRKKNWRRKTLKYFQIIKSYATSLRFLMENTFYISKSNLMFYWSWKIFIPFMKRNIFMICCEEIFTRQTKFLLVNGLLNTIRFLRTKKNRFCCSSFAFVFSYIN